MIDGSPITICRQCGSPEFSKITNTCPQCEEMAWAVYTKVPRRTDGPIEESANTKEVDRNTP